MSGKSYYNYGDGKVKAYSVERNAQIIIALLKANNIRKVIASPGATNVTFVGSIQNDPYFEIYSCVDERSAAYMACGLCESIGEPVVLSCTGATSSREYLPALSEAFKKNLPILVITSSQPNCRIGHLTAQVTDRRTTLNEAVLSSFQMVFIKDKEDEFEDTINANKALILLKKEQKPVHINLVTHSNKDFSVMVLPKVRKIEYYTDETNDIPNIPKGKIGIFIGAHIKFSKEQAKVIDDFCKLYDAAVFCDHTSGYYGSFRVQESLILSQQNWLSQAAGLSLLIHIGEITGDYFCSELMPKEVWRVSEDGEVRDYFRKLTKVFHMSEIVFFEKYIKRKGNSPSKECSFARKCQEEVTSLMSQIPVLPFGNIWIAQRLSQKLPKNSVIHFGILNSLRSWNFFTLPNGVESSCNVGGFGIDGCVSTLIGASLINPDKIYFGIVGDLAFFYDLNAFTSGIAKNNVRLLVVNNSRGTEFRLYKHIAAIFGNDADKYMAAAGHNGNKSLTLLKDLSANLGINYLSASSKEEFLSVEEMFISKEPLDKPVILEVFVDSFDESEAMETITSFMKDKRLLRKRRVRELLKRVGLYYIISSLINKK